jgi:hypothetical protein
VVVVVLKGETELLEVVATLSPPGRLAGRLHRRKKECDQQPDDRDDDQQLDQREAAAAAFRIAVPF